LGDLRPGSITATVRKCRKPSCHCAKPNDPGHEPQFRLTRKVDNKTVTESFPNPTALRKAQREVAEFRRLQKLSKELVGEGSESIRHVGSSLSEIMRSDEATKKGVPQDIPSMSPEVEGPFRMVKKRADYYVNGTCWPTIFAEAPHAD